MRKDKVRDNLESKCEVLEGLYVSGGDYSLVKTNTAQY